MAGHLISIFLNSQDLYNIINVDLNPFKNTIILNIFENEKVRELIIKEKPDVIINCIGLLVQNSEKYHDKAVYLNSYFPHFLASLSSQIDAKLIHLSTDCVFSGINGEYKEESTKDGSSFYAKSKSLGEIINEKDLTFRMSIIGPEIKNEGTGLFHWFMMQKESIFGYSNNFWTGITTLELAKSIKKAIDNNITGLYHLVPNSKISKYHLLNLIKKIWNKDITIHPKETKFHDKSLINTRNDFNFNIPSYEQMLLELREWMIKVNISEYSKYLLQ